MGRIRQPYCPDCLQEVQEGTRDEPYLKELRQSYCRLHMYHRQRGYRDRMYITPEEAVSRALLAARLEAELKAAKDESSIDRCRERSLTMSDEDWQDELVAYVPERWGPPEPSDPTDPPVRPCGVVKEQAGLVLPARSVVGNCPDVERSDPKDGAAAPE